MLESQFFYFSMRSLYYATCSYETMTPDLQLLTSKVKGISIPSMIH